MAMHFDLVDLKLMVNIAEANSMTKGAELSNISLPAASTRIKNLEQGLGARLFYRESQGVTLTPPGQALVQHARTVMGQIEHMRGDLQAFASGVKGHLRVAANTTAMGKHLPPVLRAFLLQHPDVNVDLRERPSNDVVRAVAEGQTDIGIAAGVLHTDKLQTFPYRNDRLVLVVPRGHELAGHPAVCFADTLDYEHVGLHEARAIHLFLRQAAEKLHKPLKLRIQVSSFESICRMVDACIGLSVVPESTARPHALYLKIAIVPLLDDWAVRAMQICVRDLDVLPSFARDLVDMLVENGRAAEAIKS
jgi:DNA-binding transcriptional LysR family regulator